MLPKLKMRSDKDASPVCIASDDELSARSDSFIDATCYSMDFLGLTDLAQGTGVKIGVIDSGTDAPPAKRGRRTSAPAQSLFDGFSSKPVVRSFHNCKRATQPSYHAILCASIVGGKIRMANFFGMYDGEIRGGVPSAQLFIYAIGCTQCRKLYDHFVKAFDQAINDGVKVISMSQSDPDRDLIETFLDDTIGLSTAKAFRSGILVCLSAGNEGPFSRSIVYGMPWVLTVGAITISRTLIAEVEIGVASDVPINDDDRVKVLDTVKDVRIIAKFKGVSCNIFEEDFCKLSMKSFRIKGEESILSKDFKSKTIKMVPAERKHKNQVLLLDPSKVPLTSICAEDCERLQRLRKRLGYPDLYVRISRSKVKKDDRGLYVPDFSARGPSPLYEDTIVPDVVAPGYAILSSFPSDKSIFLSDKGKRCYNDQRIASGTSMAAPHVAAQIAEIWSHRPIWGPSILKSAAITTARSLSAEGIPGNEFAFGAGLIQVDKAIDPGLVYEESDANFERYRKRSLSVYHLNLPSFAASFGTSSDYVERVFHRNLTNIGDGSANYKFEVQLINNTLDPNVSIEVFPKELKFLPRQNHMYTIVVKVIPRPGGSYSGLLKWVHQIDNDQTVRRHDVCSPIISYHKSAYPYIVS